ncbi:FCSD flavin-binding domain-containing protein [Kaarinaea lacus]
MKNSITRRRFIKSSAAVSASVVASSMWPLNSFALGGKPKPRVVIVGGGFGGVTCAKYIKKFDANIDVTIVERDAKFVTCPFSNLVLGGIKNISDITHGYDALKGKHGVNVVQDEVTDLDTEKQIVKTKGGKQLEYDRVVLSPGIDFLWDKVEGFSADDVNKIPHAWKAGEQTLLLKKQIEAMPDGGTVVIVAPPNPFRCPPGPYERASMIAHYLKQNKPKSKVLILDAKEKFSKMPLFTQGWEALYPGMIEWVAATKGGIVTQVHADEMTVYNEAGEAIKGDVINYIPHQTSGAIARQAKLADDTGWCPVNQKTFESTLVKNAHVIGDSSIASPLPKSGYAASSEGKMCAAAIVAAINNVEMPDPSYSNTCYSLVGPQYGISVAAVYRLKDGKIAKVDGAGGVSPKDADSSFRNAEALYASGWYASITADMFG